MQINTSYQVSQISFARSPSVHLCLELMLASAGDLCSQVLLPLKKWPSASQRNPTGAGAPPVINVLEINWGGGEDYEADSACFQFFLLDLFSR